MLIAFAGFWLTTSASALDQERPPLSPRNASYTIEVRLDPTTKTLAGREIVAWRNDTHVAADELWFHLYYNAWKNNRSTWLQENLLSRSPRLEREIQPGDWSYIRVTSFKVLPQGPFEAADLSSHMRHATPDDNNPDDHTVMVIPLLRPVRSGKTIHVELTWEAKIPRTFARTGFRGDFFFFAQWFPKLGVYQPDGKWNCHQFHSNTEFFSDFGIYDVKMTVPTEWPVGATGREVSVVDNGDGTSTHHYRQADVHDFAWTTSPAYREARRRFEHPDLQPVELRLLYQPEHEGQVGRHLDAAEAALEYFGTWYGEYPYDHLTLVDPVFRGGANGMEYPTLVTCGTRYLSGDGDRTLERVVVHEVGHQFWYGIVANNEFEDAWLDEGLTTFSADRIMQIVFGGRRYTERFFRGFFPVSVRGIPIDRTSEWDMLAAYAQAARSDVPSTPSYLYFPRTAGPITYFKPTLWLHMLERRLGWEAVREILSTFFQRWQFRHPKPDDFFAIAQELSAEDLATFVDQVYGRAAVFDFSVDSVASEEVTTEGFVEREGELVYVKEETSPRLYETRVVVRRLQDGVLPVEVLLKFEDGEEMREAWTGRSLWKLYRVVRPARLEYAAVDPERKLLLDINYTNNSKLLDSEAAFPATKWASKWMIWLQDYLQTLAFLF